MIASMRRLAYAFDRLTRSTFNAPRWDAENRRYIQP